jgi:carbonic anhydrase
MRMLAITVALAATAAAPGHHHWSYAGPDGPTHWAELDHEFAACGAGKNQSPIDIRTNGVRKAPLPALKFDYRPSALHIIDNGHSIQANVDPGSYMVVGNDRYELVQLHFHHPSEERIDGKGAEMVAHLVHRDAKGNLAVVAVLFDSGSRNAMVDTLWRSLPTKQEVESSPKGVRIDPGALIPADHGYFTYIGSLTTPPCAEGVRWFVLKSRQTLSSHEIATFAAHYPNDARPVQNLNGREVLTSN